MRHIVYLQETIPAYPKNCTFNLYHTKSNIFNPYQTTNFRLFHTEKFADENFKFDENGRKLSKWVENNVGKGEIAHYEQFLLFPKCFQKACFPGASKGVIVWEWVKPREAGTGIR